MCGILGFVGEYSKKDLEKGSSLLVHRGNSSHTVIDEDLFLFHRLHAVVENVKQPLKSKGEYFVANCEIYNWKALKKLHKITAKNDAELLFKLLQKLGLKALDVIDGDYAFVWVSEKNVVLARDIVGVKPLVYSHSKKGFVSASEEKALTALGFEGVHLNPREIITYDRKKKKIVKKKRKFFTLSKTILKKNERKEIDLLVDELSEKILNAVWKRVKDLKKFGILFSGGIDSTLLALICKKLGKKPTLYTSAVEYGGRESPDLVASEKAAKWLGFKLKKKVHSLSSAEKVFKKVIVAIEDRNVMKVGVAAPFYVASGLAHKDGVKVLLSGIGSEELFAGYDRHLKVLWKKGNVNKECLSGLEGIWERDLYRDDLVTMANTVELRVPFLDIDLIQFSKDIPASLKINADMKKIILRKVAVSLGMPSAFAERKKLGAQYGSNFDKALEKLAKQKKVKYKKEYLDSL